MPNVILKRKSHVSPFRKVAIGTWQTTYDPSIYGTLRVRADKLLSYIEAFRRKTGRRLTLTHVVVKATAIALKACPDANAILRFNQIYLRQSVDIAMLVMMENNGELDLSSAKIVGADQKSLIEIIDETEKKVGRIRTHQDPELEQTRQSMQFVPAICMNFLLKVLSFFIYALNWDLSKFGIPKDAFGSAIVTSVGPLGLDTGYAPIVPYSRVPMYVAPGEVHDEAVVENGQVVVGKVLNVNATFDHRIVDGAHCAILLKAFRKVMEDPYGNLDAI